MVKELQALCLDIRVLDENGESVDISGVVDDDTPTFNNIEEVERSVDAENEKGDSDMDEELDEEFDDSDFDEEFDDDDEFFGDEDYADDEE